jgi:hypothetical protein
LISILIGSSSSSGLSGGFEDLLCLLILLPLTRGILGGSADFLALALAALALIDQAGGVRVASGIGAHLLVKDLLASIITPPPRGDVKKTTFQKYNTFS